jgi:hypothetical protein
MKGALCGEVRRDVGFAVRWVNVWALRGYDGRAALLGATMK